MASDPSITQEGYLRWLLADGVKAVRYRNQVSWLLGIPRADLDLVPRPSPQPPVVFSDLSAGLWSAPAMAPDFPWGDPREHSDPVEGRRALSSESSEEDANLTLSSGIDETAAGALPTTPESDRRPVVLKPAEEEMLAAHDPEHGPGNRNATTALRTLLGLPNLSAARPGHPPVGFVPSPMAAQPAEFPGIVNASEPAESRGEIGRSDAPSQLSGRRPSVPGTSGGIVEAGGALIAPVHTIAPVPSPVPPPITTRAGHGARRASAGTVSPEAPARREPSSPGDAETSDVLTLLEPFIEGHEARRPGPIDSGSHRASGGSKATCWSDERAAASRCARPPSRSERADDREPLERCGTMEPATATAAPEPDRPLGSPHSKRDAPRVAAGRLLPRSRNADVSSDLDLPWRSASVLGIGPGSRALAQIESLQRTVRELSEQLAQTQLEVRPQPHSEKQPPAPSAMTGRRRAWTENTARAYWERCYLARVQFWGPG